MYPPIQHDGFNDEDSDCEGIRETSSLVDDFEKRADNGMAFNFVPITTIAIYVDHAYASTKYHITRLLDKKSSTKVALLLRLALFTILAMIFFMILQRPSFEDQAAIQTTLIEAQVIDQQCSLVSVEYIHIMRNTSEPSIHAFHDGVPVESDKRLQAPVTFCLMVAVPQKPLNQYRNGPVPGTGPDAISLYIHSETQKLPMQPPIPMPGMGADKQFSPGTLLYFRDVRLLTGETYIVDATIELRNWDWAGQYDDNPDTRTRQYLSGLRLPIPEDEVIIGSPQKILYKFPPTIVVGRSPAQPSQKQPCSDQIGANRGRWRLATKYPSPGGLVDEFGYAWHGDDCELQLYTDEDIVDCLENRTIHVFGDSNSRRLGRSIITGGRYCHKPLERCQLEERADPIFKLMDFNGELVMQREAKYDQWRYPEEEFLDFEFGRGSRLYHSFQRLIVHDWQDWTRKLYDKKWWSDRSLSLSRPPDSHEAAFRPGVDLKPGAEARPPPSVAAADVVILAFGTWDETYLPFLTEFDRVLPLYRDAMFEAYPNAKFVLRLSHSVCCAPVWYESNRYNSLRIQYFNDVMRRVFQIDESGTRSTDGRVLVVDPSQFIGAPDDNDGFEVFNIHLRYSRVRTEANMMFNAVCKKDSQTGRASWRWE